MLISALFSVFLQTQSIAFTNVGVVDVERGRIVAGQTVVVTGNRIAEVGRTGSIRVPESARAVDGTGKFLIPGLWDMHVHAVTPWFGPGFLPLLVANGVTGVRDMFTVTAAVDSWRSEITSGRAVGPRTGTFGSLVDGDPPIWGPQSIVAKTPADGRRIVDSLKAARTGFVKVYSRLDPATFAAIAERANEIGIPFAGHIPSLVPASEAIRLGQRTVEHLTQILLGCSNRETELLAETNAAYQSAKRWDSVAALNRGRNLAILASQDDAKCERLADQFKRAGGYFVPTTTVLRSIANFDDTTLAGDPRLKYIAPFIKTGWNPKTDFRFRTLTPEDWAVRRRLHARELEVIRIFQRRGVKFLAGTDLANPFLYPGFSLHDELSLFVSLGMTPLAALQTATIEPARFLGATDSLGSVARGKVADLVLVDADPLANIEAVRSISAVVADGRLFDRAALDTLLADGVARAAAPTTR